MEVTHSKIYVAPSTVSGRGVFAAEAIAEGAIIEVCPVLRISKISPGAAEFSDYYFKWEEDYHAIPLGYGMLYNHSETPNADWENNYETQEIIFIALRAIEPGEEIFAHYGAGWFENRGDAPQKEENAVTQAHVVSKWEPPRVITNSPFLPVPEHAPYLAILFFAFVVVFTLVFL